VAFQGVVQRLAGQLQPLAELAFGGVSSVIDVIDGFIETVDHGQQVADQRVVRVFDTTVVFSIDALELSAVFIVFLAHCVVV